MYAETELAERIRARGLPPAVVAMATEGGAVVHPELDYRAGAVWDPSWSVIEHSGRTDLVPLWTCGTTTAYSAEDGTFVEWNAEEDEPWRTFPDFFALVRSLLTDLWEDEVADPDRREIAGSLLPGARIEDVLRPEER